MAALDAQISAQVTTRQKEELAQYIAADSRPGRIPSEGDVIRVALALGLQALGRIDVDTRVRAYALGRRGLNLNL